MGLLLCTRSHLLFPPLHGNPITSCLILGLANLIIRMFSGLRKKVLLEMQKVVFIIISLDWI